MMSSAPIIIVGCQRSGTTMMRVILDQHPALLVHPAEPQFFLELANRFGQTLPDGSVAVEHILQHPYKAAQVTPENFSAPQENLAMSELVQGYMAAWMGESNRQPVLKHPALAYHLDLVNDWFPDAVIINVVRDPRANVSSQRNRWPQFSVWHCAMLWRQAAISGREWAGRFPHRYLEVQYESVVLSPDITMQRVCSQLSIPFTEQLLTFDQQETMWEPGAAPQKKRFTAPDPARMNLWQQRLTPEEIQLIESCCRPQMAWWDYQPLYETPLPPALRLRQFREAGKYQLVTWAKRIRSQWQRRKQHFSYR